MNFLYVLIAAAAVFFSFTINLWFGIGLSVLIIILGVIFFRPKYFLIKGNQEYSKGNEEKALEWYRKAYGTGKMNVKTKASYAYLLLRTGHEDEAEAVLDPIIRVSGLDAQKRNLAKQQRCMVYYRQGRLDEAIEEAQELYDDGFITSSLYGMLGYFKMLRGDSMDEVLKVCEEAYDYDDGNRDILDNLALCYYRLGRYEEAKRVSDELLASAQPFTEGCYHGAQIAAALGDFDRAKELLAKLDECKRNKMTTITEQEIEKLKKQVSAGKKTHT